MNVLKRDQSPGHNLLSFQKDKKYFTVLSKSVIFRLEPIPFYCGATECPSLKFIIKS